MAPAIDPRSALGALGPTDLEQALSDPQMAQALLQELDPEALPPPIEHGSDLRQRMLAASMRLARQIVIDHLRRQRSSPVTRGESS